MSIRAIWVRKHVSLEAICVDTYIDVVVDVEICYPVVHFRSEILYLMI